MLDTKRYKQILIDLQSPMTEANYITVLQNYADACDPMLCNEQYCLAALFDIYLKNIAIYFNATCTNPSLLASIFNAIFSHMHNLLNHLPNHSQLIEKIFYIPELISYICSAEFSYPELFAIRQAMQDNLNNLEIDAMFIREDKRTLQQRDAVVGHRQHSFNAARVSAQIINTIGLHKDINQPIRNVQYHDLNDKHSVLEITYEKSSRK